MLQLVNGGNVMKRIYIIVITVICAMAVFGCGKKETSGNLIGGKGVYEAEYFERDISGENDSVTKTISIDFMGKNYQMEYYKTRESYIVPYVANEYRDGNNSIKVVEDTQSISSFRSELYYGNEEERNYSLPLLTEDELRTIADEYASKVIDVQEYQVEVKDEAEYNAYQYSYTRYIDGYETSDYFKVTLSNRGELLEYRDSLMRNMEYVSLEGFDKEKAYDAVKEALKEYRPDAYVDTFVPEAEILTLTEDNEIAFYYRATVVIDKEGGYREAIPVRLIW